MSLPSDPLTFTWTTAPGAGLIVTGVAPIRRQNGAISLNDTLGQPKQCGLTVGNDADAARLGITDIPPQVGANVDVETLGRRLLVGTTITTTQILEGRAHAQKRWDATVLGWAYALNRLIPFGQYTGSATTVVAALVTDSAPGFTVAHVQAGLPDVTLDLDGSLTFGAVLDEICTQMGGGFHWVDDDQDVHLGQTPEVDEVPDALNNTSTTLQWNPAVRYTLDVSQVRTRVFVRGTGCFATWDDLTAQAAMVLIMGGDGVIEAPVISRPELTTEAACLLYAQAVTAVYGGPIGELAYDTRDPKTGAGKTVPVNITTATPPIVGDFLIQTVTIDRIAVNDDTFPVFHVTASSVRVTVEDVFRRSQPSAITGNAGTASRLQAARTIHGVPFDGSANIDLSETTYAQTGFRVYS
jgi:hypothetical protein